MEFCVNAIFYIAKLIQLSYLHLLYEVLIYQSLNIFLFAERLEDIRGKQILCRIVQDS
jgi:hypothetical protein